MSNYQEGLCDGRLVGYHEGQEEGFRAGRETMQLEIAKRIKDLANNTPEILLHAGEMTAQELRTVKAVLNWLVYEIENRSP